MIPKTITTLKPIARTRARGFTLIELLVAMIGSMLVTASAFAFSKYATQHFARETRLATAQLSAMSGFQRLASDIARASYMASPNLVRDVAFSRVCPPVGDPTLAQWRLAGLVSGIQITKLAAAGAPDSIRIIGNLSSSDVFPVRQISDGGAECSGGLEIYLQPGSGSLTRLGALVEADTGPLGTVFKRGRLLRIVDQDGREEYTVVATAGILSSGPYICVPSSGHAGVPLRGNSTVTCGISGLGVGTQVNVVNVVDYSVESLGATETAKFAALYTLDSSATAQRDLARRERFFLDQNGTDIPTTLSATPIYSSVEQLTEFVVNLKFGVRMHKSPVGGAADTAVRLPSTLISTTFTPGTTVAGTYASGNDPDGPDSIRSVQVTLSARSIEADRAADVTMTNVTTAQGNVLRQSVTSGTVTRYARVRTINTEIALANQRGSAWVVTP